jgi:hypothetical protein
MPQLCFGVHDYERVREEMRLLKQLGFERVYFVLNPPGFPTTARPFFGVMPAGNKCGNHSFESLLALGDPNWAYLHACHEQGMEAWAIIKPYEWGGITTIPHGRRARCSVAHVPTVGGERISFSTLLSNHPELALARRPEPALEKFKHEPVTAIEIVFCLDPVRPNVERIENWNSQSSLGNGEWPGFPAGSEPAVQALKLWTSRDNGRYQPFEGRVNVSAHIESRPIHDPNGTLLFNGESKRCLVLRASGFSIPADTPYLGVTLEPVEGLITIPNSMIKAFGPRGDELPITLATAARQGHDPADTPETHAWGEDKDPCGGMQAAETFQKWGFEFEYTGDGWPWHGPWEDGWQISPVFGIGRGKFTHAKGIPCEGYPAVRECWLDEVRRALAMGYDGIDLRLQNNVFRVGGYVNYGYNQPLVERYRQKHGIDILKEPADPLKLMAVRGDFYLDFVEAAAGAIHAAGRKLQVHLHHCYQAPRLHSGNNELGFLGLPQVLPDWQRAVALADEITIKDYHFGHYRPEMSGQIKRRANELGKRVWVHCYIGQGKELTEPYFADIEADDTVDGVLLYEVGDHSGRGLIEQIGPAAYSEKNVAVLRAIMRRSGFGVELVESE